MPIPGVPTASQAEAEAGTIDDKAMTPLRVAQAAQFGNFDPGATGAMLRSILAKLRERRSFGDFGAVGDGATDNAVAFQAALDWLAGADHRSLTLDDGSYRLMSGVSINLGSVWGSHIDMRGAIKPDGGIGIAIGITGAKGGHFVLRVLGGGQTAVYSQADPPGRDEAFRLVNALDCDVQAHGANYAGRMLRLTSESPSTNFTCQLMRVSVSTMSTASKTASPEDRLKAGVGQAFYIDTKSSAFGEITSAFFYWEKYGSVLERTSDVVINFIDSLHRGETGFEIRGGLSIWGGHWNLGCELGTLDLVTFKPSSGGGPASNIYIAKLFVVGGRKGLVCKDIGTAGGTVGLEIGYLQTNANFEHGAYFDNCRKIRVNHTSVGDKVAIETSGTCIDWDYSPIIAGAKSEAMIIGAGADAITVQGGHIRNSSVDVAAPTHAVRIQTTGLIQFFGTCFSESSAISVFSFPASNTVRIHGGRLTLGGSTTRYSGSIPNRVIEMAGWITAMFVTATIPNGASSVTVAHGLAGTPSDFWLGARGHAETASAYVSAVDGTNLTVSVPSPVTAARNVSVRATLNYGPR